MHNKENVTVNKCPQKKNLISKAKSKQPNFGTSLKEKTKRSRDSSSVISATELKNLKASLSNTSLPVVSAHFNDNSDSVNESNSFKNKNHAGLTVKSSQDTTGNHLLQNEDIIDSVLKKVVELNRDKLPESSLVKVLASVYLDSKAKLENLACDKTLVEASDCLQFENSKVDNVHPSLKAEPENSNNSINTAIFLSTAEKKKLQWEKERAELSALNSLGPWGKKSSAVFSNNIPFSMSQGISSTGTCASFCAAPTAMVFGASEEAVKLQREEQRRQWKAALDEQLKENQLRNEKKIEEIKKQKQAELRELEALALTQQSISKEHNMVQSTQPQIQSKSLQIFSNDVGKESVMQNQQNQLMGEDQNVSEPIIGLYSSNNSGNAHISHPSASHFSSSDLGLLLPQQGMQTSEMNLDKQINSGFYPENSVNNKVGFNRVRGFTQELYTDSNISMERARIAREIRIANLKQIEEKKRLKEEQKAREAEEEKREEERILRECARLQKMAELEDAHKRAKQSEEQSYINRVYDTVIPSKNELKSQVNQINSQFPNYQPQFNDNTTIPNEKLSNNHSGQKIHSIQNDRFSTNSNEIKKETQNLEYSYNNNHFKGNTEISQNRMSNNLDYNSTPHLCSLAVQTSFLEDHGVQTDPETVPSNEKNRTYQLDLENIYDNNIKSKLNNNKSTKSQQLIGRKLKGNYSNDHLNHSTLNNRRIPYNNNVSQNSKFQSMSNLKTNSSSVSDKVKGSLNKKANDSINLANEHKQLGSTQNHFTNKDSKNNSIIPNSNNSFPKTRIPIAISRIERYSNNSNGKRFANESLNCKHIMSNPSMNTYEPIGLIRTYDVLNPKTADLVSLPSEELTENKNSSHLFVDKSDQEAQLLMNDNVSSNQSVLAKDMKTENDPLLNPGIVCQHPTARQDIILQQLSAIRKGLQLRRMLCESANYEDSD